MEILFSFPRLSEFLEVEDWIAKDGMLFDALDVDSDHPCRLINYQFNEFDSVCCLLDRNVVTDLVSLVRGKRVPKGPAGNTLRLIAGFQAFLNASEIMSEPSIAYHEYIESAGFEEADSELAVFRSADNLDANIYLDIALGKLDRVPERSIPAFEAGEILAKEHPVKLKHFERNLVTVKKAIVLKAQGLNSYEVMLKLTDWLYFEYIFTMPAFHFLSLYLSNGRIRGMLKSHHREAVRNATWDLCFLEHWLSLIKRDRNVRWLAATRDKAIKDTKKGVGDNFIEKYQKYLKNRLTLCSVRCIRNYGWPDFSASFEARAWTIWRWKLARE